MSGRDYAETVAYHYIDLISRARMGVKSKVYIKIASRMKMDACILLVEDGILEEMQPTITGISRFRLAPEARKRATEILDRHGGARGFCDVNGVPVQIPPHPR